ncbi:MAG: hypothetical protein EOP49_47290, partial [Sphingobacteriales bacterium]
MKHIAITLAAAVLMASCHFESDKDYKKFDKDSTKHEASGHGGRDAGTRSHDAGSDLHDAGTGSHGAAGVDSAGQTNPHSSAQEGPAGSAKDAQGNIDSTVGGKPTSGIIGSGTRKARGTVADWNEDRSASKEMDAEGVYVNADVMPEYPGGKKAIQKFIEDNIQYPKEAIDGDVQGTVQITFAVDENGNVYK